MSRYFQCLVYVILVMAVITPPGIALSETVQFTTVILTDGQTFVEDSEIILDEDTEFDVSDFVEEIEDVVKDVINEEIKEILSEKEVILTQQVTLIADSEEEITLSNTDLPTVVAEIPDETTIYAPEEWDQTITPPIEVDVTGEIPSGFSTPDISIQVGSPDVVLIFDKPVTLILSDTTGQIFYKLAGETTWISISECLGTYDLPTDPDPYGECSITDGTDTKILTYHFTEFAGTSSTTETTTDTTSSVTTSSSSGGGSGAIGVSVGTEEFAGTLLEESVQAFPTWFKTFLTVYWLDELVTDEEFKEAVRYLLNQNIILVEVAEEQEQAGIHMIPLLKPMFKMWSDGDIGDQLIIKTVSYYRTLGVW